MNATHTPGPWKWNATDACIWPTNGTRRAEIAVVFTAKEPTSELSGRSDTFTVEEEANAALIAAAPDLLRCLSNLHDELQRAFDDVPAGVDAWMAEARIALAAAQPARAAATPGGAL